MQNQSSKSASESIEKCDYPQRFRSFREKSSLKQGELAALLDIHPNYISQIERGEKVPGKQLLKSFRILEDAPLYKSANRDGEPQSMPPPHQIHRQQLPDPKDQKKSPHECYAEGVNILGYLLEHHPSALAALLATLRGIYELYRKK